MVGVEAGNLVAVEVEKTTIGGSVNEGRWRVTEGWSVDTDPTLLYAKYTTSHVP